MKIYLYLLLIAIGGCAPAYASTIDMDAIAEIESGGDPGAVGAAGEIGLYQISPIVLKHFEQTHPGFMLEIWPSEKIKTADLFNPRLNRIIADWYFEWLESTLQIHGIAPTERHLIIAYNWGLRNFLRWHECPLDFDVGETKCPREPWEPYAAYVAPVPVASCQQKYDLPETTKNYLAKYKKLAEGKS
jgi:hypothetical protein